MTLAHSLDNANGSIVDGSIYEQGSCTGLFCVPQSMPTLVVEHQKDDYHKIRDNCPPA